MIIQKTLVGFLPCKKTSSVQRVVRISSVNVVFLCGCLYLDKNLPILDASYMQTGTLFHLKLHRFFLHHIMILGKLSVKSYESIFKTKYGRRVQNPK